MSEIKPSQILREAASVINSGLKSPLYERGGCCAAISVASHKLNGGRLYHNEPTSTCRARKLFASLYSNGESYWFSPIYTFKFRKKEQEHRIMSLLLTADMCESVGE